MLFQNDVCKQGSAFLWGEEATQGEYGKQTDKQLKAKDIPLYFLCPCPSPNPLPLSFTPSADSEVANSEE